MVWPVNSANLLARTHFTSAMVVSVNSFVVGARGLCPVNAGATRWLSPVSQLYHDGMLSLQGLVAYLQHLTNLRRHALDSLDALTKRLEAM